MALRSVKFENYRSFRDGAAELPLNQEFLGIVGVNNAGKSSLLRAFWELRSAFDRVASIRPGAAELRQFFSVGGLGGTTVRLLPGERIEPAGAGAVVKPKVSLVIERSTSDPEQVHEVRIFIGDAGVIRGELLMGDGTVISYAEVQNILNLTDPNPSGVISQFELHSGVKMRVDWIEAISHLRDLASSVYVGAFRNSINAGGNPYYDLAVGRDFISAFNNYKTGPDPAANEAIQKMTDEIADIFGIQQFDVSPSADGSQLRYIIDGVSHRDSELGAGIAQFVIVAATVLVKKPWLLLIDEPELNLHASLQLRFLTLLAQYVSGPVIFSSHSLGLARAGADRILVASRNSRGSSILRDYQASTNLAQTLGELGYGGLHDEAYKAVLLVEGVTEVRAMLELLRKYGVRNEVLCIPLGGDNLAVKGRDLELDQLRQLSPLTFAIVDSEGTKAGPAHSRRRAFAETCAHLGIECLVLERRAIENYLNHPASDSVMGITDASSIAPYDPAPTGWSKEKNWRAIRGIDRSHFDDTDLGKFVAKIAERVIK